MNKFKALFDAAQDSPEPEAKPLRTSVATLERSQGTELLLSKIKLPANQPRKYFDPDKLAQLTRSIQEHGVLEPLLVRPVGDDYELVAGERRYRAAKAALLKSVPVLIKGLDDRQARQVALVENLQREDLNPVEEAEAILQLLEIELNQSREVVLNLLYRMRNGSNGMTSQNVLTSKDAQVVRSLFDALGRLSWESFITVRLPLLKLPTEILDSVKEGKIAYTKAQTIARVKSAAWRDRLLDDAVSQNLSLSQIKQRIAEIDTAPPKVDDSVQLKTRADDAYRKLKRSKVWQDPKKQKRLERLVSQIEELLDS